MPTRRLYMGAAALGGVLYVVGGQNRHNAALATLEAYDPKTNPWSTKTPMPTRRDGLSVAVVDGTLYAIGGTDGGMFASVEAYDPLADAWWSVTPMRTGRHQLVSAVVDDTVYAVGGLGFNCCLGSEPFLAVNEAFSPFLHIAIDIKPGDPSNTVPLNSGGTLPVAILGSATFDALTVDPATVTLAGASPASSPPARLADTNRDGFPDLLLHFRIRQLQLRPQSTEAVLYGETFSGQRIRGADAVHPVPPPRAPRAFAPAPARIEIAAWAVLGPLSLIPRPSSVGLRVETGK